MRLTLKWLWVLLALAVTASGCNRAIVRGRVRPVEPLTRSYAAPREEVYRAAKQALSMLDYSIESEQPAEGLIETKWQGTRAVSHYTELFDQRDFGTVGSYYRLELRIREREGKTEVVLSAPVKSLAPHQRSTSREERRVLGKISDLLRREDFEMTNVGVE